MHDIWKTMLKSRPCNRPTIKQNYEVQGGMCPVNFDCNKFKMVRLVAIILIADFKMCDDYDYYKA